MTARVSIQSITRKFGEFTALDNVSLDIDAGEFIVLLGPSGCGKTTLLSILGGFLTSTSGKVLVADRDMSGVLPAKRPTTTMFQDYALFPHMTLADNVGFGLRMRGVPRKARRAKAEELLEMVGLKDAADRKPHELSGGQRQRVALARALAVDPDVLLLDEPLGALDLKLRRQMQDELKAIQKRVGTTFVHVTHDQEEAMAIADRIVVMNQGRIEDFGSPSEIYMRPKSLFSAGFMGEVNFISGRIVELLGDKVTLGTKFGHIEVGRKAFTAAQEPEACDDATLCIRPEHFHPVPNQPGATSLGPARIIDSAFFGTHFRCHLVSERAPEISFVAHLPPTSKPSNGNVLDLTLNLGEVVVVPGNPEENGQ